MVDDVDRRRRFVAVHVAAAEVSAAAAAGVKSPLAAEIRLTWWLEEVERLRAGAASPGHPALRALKGLDDEPLRRLETMIQARFADLESRPFNDDAALEAYLDDADGGLLATLLGALDGYADAPRLQAVGRCLGLRRLWLEAGQWGGAGRSFIPGAPPATVRETDLRGFAALGVAQRLPAARQEVRRLPPRLFPAVAVAAMLPATATGRAYGDLGVRVRILWAALRGGI